MPTPPSVFRYGIRNWRAYYRALINRGRLTIGFDERAQSRRGATPYQLQGRVRRAHILI